MLDVGRGRWPSEITWNWGGGAGRVDGHVVGIQIGGKWTEGTGFTENGVIVDGRLTKIGAELTWTYDWDDPMAPWHVQDPGGQLDIVLTPRFDKHTKVGTERDAPDVRYVVRSSAHGRRPGARLHGPPRLRRRGAPAVVSPTRAESARPRVAPRWAPLAVLGGGVIGSRLGFVGHWFAAIGTSAHEASHAAVGDVLAGRVLSLTVFRDGGGVTFVEASSSGWRSFAVSAAGYLGALVVALAVTTAVLFTRTSRVVVLVGAALTLLALVLWVPFSPAVRGLPAGDQHFTWGLFVVVAVALAGSFWLPDTARRIVLGVVAAGLISDTFRGGRDLVMVEGTGLPVHTDADGLHDAAPWLGPTAWAWVLRGLLFLIAAAWLWWAARRWLTETVEDAERRA